VPACHSRGAASDGDPFMMTENLKQQLQRSGSISLPTIFFVDRVTVYGVAALSFTMLMYWLEHRGPVFVLGFAAGCALSSLYGFLSGAWPFGILEAVWFVLALARFARMRKVGVTTSRLGRSDPTYRCVDSRLD
jgi:hypothetical protein